MWHNLRVPVGRTRILGRQVKVLKGEQMNCQCCQVGMPTTLPRVCPECDHVFKGNGWDGIDAHWRAHHEAVKRYEDFWNSLCERHRGVKRR